MGKGMHNLGYTIPYALLRSIRFALQKPKSGIEMLSGYASAQLLTEPVTDVAEWVNSYQRKELLILIGNIIDPDKRKNLKRRLFS